MYSVPFVGRISTDSGPPNPSRLHSCTLGGPSRRSSFILGHSSTRIAATSSVSTDVKPGFIERTPACHLCDGSNADYFLYNDHLASNHSISNNRISDDCQ